MASRGGLPAERSGAARGIRRKNAPGALWDALVTMLGDPQSCGKLTPGNRGAELVEFIKKMQQHTRRFTAADFFADLCAELGVSAQAGADYRPYVDRLTRFVREWDQKWNPAPR